MVGLQTLNRWAEGGEWVHRKPECCFTQRREYLKEEVTLRCVIRAFVKRAIGMTKVSLSRAMALMANGNIGPQ